MKMFRRLVLAVVLLFPAFAHATIAFAEQSGSTQDGSGSTTLQRTLTVASGSLLVLVMTNRDDDDFPVSAAGSLNATGWQIIDGLRGASLVYRLGSAAGSETLTVTFNRTTQSSVVANFIEFTASGTLSLSDSENTQENLATTSHSHGSVNISAAGVLVGTCALSGGDTSGYSANGSYIKLDDGGGFRLMAQYRISTGSLTGETATWSSGADSINTGCVIASFVEASTVVVNPISGRGGAAARPVVTN